MSGSILPGLRFFRAVEKHLVLFDPRLSFGSPQQLVIPHQVNRLWKWLLEGIHEELYGIGLTPMSYFTLQMLYSEQDGSMAPSDLADCTGESRTNMTRICNELEALKLVQRTRSMIDRRSVDLRLTAYGIEQMEILLPRLRERAERAFAPLSEAETTQLEWLLKKVLTHHEQSAST